MQRALFSCCGKPRLISVTLRFSLSAAPTASGSRH
jgi:hypothetical protein